jgi:beta-fructofuranosidase
VSNFSNLGYYKQVQAMARPANLSDPQLKLWIKVAANPLINQPPAMGSSAQFRDPTTAWQQVRAVKDCSNLLHHERS